MNSFQDKCVLNIVQDQLTLYILLVYLKFKCKSVFSLAQSGHPSLEVSPCQKACPIPTSSKRIPSYGSFFASSSETQELPVVIPRSVFCCPPSVIHLQVTVQETKCLLGFLPDFELERIQAYKSNPEVQLFSSVSQLRPLQSQGGDSACPFSVPLLK